MPLAYINFVSGGHPDQGLPPGSPGMPDQGLPGSQPGVDNSLPTPPPGVWPPPTVGIHCPCAPWRAAWDYLAVAGSSAAPVSGVAGQPRPSVAGPSWSPGHPHRASQERHRTSQASRCRRPLVGRKPAYCHATTKA